MFIFALALSLAACTDVTPPEDHGEPAPEAWQNRTWELVSIGGKRFSAPASRKATITFTATRFSFAAPCNSGGGSYSYGPYPALTLGEGAVSIMECSTLISKKEREFLEPLFEVGRIRLVGDVFSLFTADGTELRFKPAL